MYSEKNFYHCIPQITIQSNGHIIYNNDIRTELIKNAEVESESADGDFWRYMEQSCHYSVTNVCVINAFIYQVKQCGPWNDQNS